MQKRVERESLGAVHTHTHTHTHTSIFREIKRVANAAALFGVKNRLFVALHEVKDKVLKIACFLRLILSKLKENYTVGNKKRAKEVLIEGGVG